MFLYWFTQPLGLRPVPCNHLQGFPLIQLKFTNKSHKTNLEPTRLSSIPLCSSPPHKMLTHSAIAVHHCRFECNTTIQQLNYKFPPILMPNLPIKQELIEKPPNTRYNSKVHKHNNQLQSKATRKNTYLPILKLPRTIYQDHAMLLFKCRKILIRF